MPSIEPILREQFEKAVERAHEFDKRDRMTMDEWIRVETNYEWTGEVSFLPERLDAPLHRRKRAVIGVCFMGDLFHEKVTDQAILSVFNTISMGPPQHTYVVLTKRPKRMREFVGRYLGEWRPQFNGVPLFNLVLGVSIWDQPSADRMIPELLATPAACRIVSVEPMLGPIGMRPMDDFSDRGHGMAWLPHFVADDGHGYGPVQLGRKTIGLDGIILGGESGPGARPMHPEWAQDVFAACHAAGVPYYFKQWGDSKEYAHLRPAYSYLEDVKQLPEVMVP